MSETRILTAEDFDALVRIFVDAYPAYKIQSDEEQQRFKQRVLQLHEQEPTACFHGLFRKGELLGIMCLYDFAMNFLNTRIPAGGVGQIAVALPHKKEHVAKEMMLYYLRYYRERRTPLAVLYPFRPDFYRNMGFGYGTKMDQYRLKPAALPRGPSKAHVRFLDGSDKRALLDCYNRFLDKTHGMMAKSELELARLFENPQHRLVGYEQDGQIRGYLVFTFDQGETFILNDINIRELIYETPEALSELLTFLHTQADQIRHVLVNTQDEYFHHMLSDPRNDSGRLIPDVYHETNAQGVGLMYRVIDTPGMLDRLSGRNLGTPRPDDQACTLKLTIADSFLPENAGSILLHFHEGCVQRLENGVHDVEASLDIGEFSSLLVGTVDFNSLYRYGLAEISNEDYVDIVNRIFAVEQKPMCTTPF